MQVPQCKTHSPASQIHVISTSGKALGIQRLAVALEVLSSLAHHKCPPKRMSQRQLSSCPTRGAGVYSESHACCTVQNPSSSKAYCQLTPEGSLLCLSFPSLESPVISRVPGVSFPESCGEGFLQFNIPITDITHEIHITHHISNFNN